MHSAFQNGLRAVSRLHRISGHIMATTAKLSTISNNGSDGALPYKEIKIPVPWGHIAAKDWGDPNSHPLLGIHGWQDNSNSFDLIAPLLPKNLRFVAVDLPGHGISSWIARGDIYDNFIFVTTVERLRRYFDWNYFSVIAHSMGAIAAYWYASAFPQYMNKLVTLDSTYPFALKQYDQAAYAKCIQQLIQFEHQESAGSPPTYTMDQLVERTLKTSHNFMTAPSARIILERGTVRVDGGRYVLTRDKRTALLIPMNLSIEEMIAIVRGIKCDLLLIAATDGGPYLRHTDQEIDEFLENYRVNKRSYRFVKVEGTHHVHLNNPERVAPILQEYFKDC